jgi:maleylacetate reductase
LSSGIRAFDHAVEGICSPKCNPFAEALAEKGIAELADSLARNKSAPDDLVGRRRSQFAAWYATMPLVSGVAMGASHAIGHAIGSMFNVAHGLTSCVVLPAVIQFNGETVAPRLANVVRALGGQRAQGAPDLVRAMIARLGLPISLRDIGLGRDSFPRIARAAMTEGWIKSNPRPIDREEDIIRILELAA